MYELKDIYGSVIYVADAATTIAGAVRAAVLARKTLARVFLRGAYLRGAYLQGADLRGAYLRGAYLQGADLRGAYLQDADLRGADLRGAYLQDADLRGAYLRGAYLQDADLRGAYLQDADLQDADLQGADLRGAYLQDADLQDADLQGADLRGAYLQDADLRGADLRGARGLSAADIARMQIVPETGAFVGYKSAYTETGKVILRLEIPANAARVGGVCGRKCRAEYVRVLAVLSTETGEELPADRMPARIYAGHDGEFTYIPGEVARPDKWDPDPLVECTHGIHFFLTVTEAREW